MWRESWLRFREWTRVPRHFFGWCRLMWDYAPILWNDVDWDYSSILRLLQYKLSRTRKYIVEHDRHLHSQKYGKQMAHAEFLIDRILIDEYLPKEVAAHDEKYGEWDWDFTPCNDGTDCSFMTSKNAKCATPQEQKRADNARHTLYKKQEAAKQKDYDRLFSHIRKYIQHWWD